MIKNKIIYLLFLLAFTSCNFRSFGPGAQDFTKDLPNGYMIARTSAHQIQIVPEDGWGSNTPIIITKVLKLNTHKELVLAYRQGLKRRSPEDPKDGYMIPDSEKFDYWILDTKTPKVFPNLTKSEFEQKKKELGVPISFELINVYNY